MSDTDNKTQELISFVREARKFLKYVESPGWYGSVEGPDQVHIDDLKTQLELTRERLCLPDATVMHSVRNTKTGLVLAYTGNTPDAAERARFLTGLMQALPSLLETIESCVTRKVSA
jgi:hypothetical protein